jgi:hypothetical protein
MQPLPAHPKWKDALMAPLVLDTVTTASDADTKTVKVMNDIQDFVS